MARASRKIHHSIPSTANQSIIITGTATSTMSENEKATNNSLEQIDNLVSELQNTEWKGSIFFDVDKGATGVTKKVDICSLLYKKNSPFSRCEVHLHNVSAFSLKI